MDVSFTLPSCPSGDSNNNVDDGGDRENVERVMHVRLQFNFALFSSTNSSTNSIIAAYIGTKASARV